MRLERASPAVRLSARFRAPAILASCRSRYGCASKVMRRILFVLGFAATLGAQTFIQMSDPQFGMYTKDASFEHETLNFEFAIATANRLKPAFVVITGDLVNQSGNDAQVAEYKRIVAKLDP